MDDTRRQERLLLVSCLAVLAILVGIDAISGPRIAISGSYGLAAVLGSAFLPVRQTLTLAATAFVAAALSFVWNDNLGLDWAVKLAIVLALSATAFVIAHNRVARERRLARMTLIAEVAQRALLRAMPPAVGQVGFAARYVSAAEEARIGGDLYEVVPTDFGTRAIVGDVRGKGLEAVQLAATVLAAFRRSAPATADLAALARELDTVVTAVADIEDFVTAVLVQFGEDGVLEVVNLGHLPPILVDGGNGGRARLLETGEPVPPLGLHPRPHVARTSWDPGMRLLLYTDGTTEGRDRAGRFFELADVSGSLAAGSLDDALDRLIGALSSHVGHEITDDVALVLAENRGVGAGRP